MRGPSFLDRFEEARSLCAKRCPWRDAFSERVMRLTLKMRGKYGIRAYKDDGATLDDSPRGRVDARGTRNGRPARARWRAPAHYADESKPYNKREPRSARDAADGTRQDRDMDGRGTARRPVNVK